MRNPTDLDLRSLDAADAADAPLAPLQQREAAALLERIVATPVISDDTSLGAPGQKRLPRKLFWVPVAAAAVAVGSIVIPGLGGSATAYASWTATPSAVAALDLAAVTAACRRLVADNRGPDGVSFDVATIPVDLAERRGDFVAVLFHQDNPDYSVSCVATNRPGSGDVHDVTAAAGGGSGPTWVPPAGRLTEGGISQFGTKPPASFTDGAVGAGVVGVTIHAGPDVITATVKNGRYAAWWPGRAFADGPLPPSGEGGPRTILTYDVTLSDGTTKTNVAPARPA